MSPVGTVARFAEARLWWTAVASGRRLRHLTGDDGLERLRDKVRDCRVAPAVSYPYERVQVAVDVLEDGDAADRQTLPVRRRRGDVGAAALYEDRDGLDSVAVQKLGRRGVDDRAGADLDKLESERQLGLQVERRGSTAEIIPAPVRRRGWRADHPHALGPHRLEVGIGDDCRQGDLVVSHASGEDAVRVSGLEPEGLVRLSVNPPALAALAGMPWQQIDKVDGPVGGGLVAGDQDDAVVGLDEPFERAVSVRQDRQLRPGDHVLRRLVLPVGLPV